MRTSSSDWRSAYQCAELALQNLARGVFRQTGDELDMARDFVRCKVASTIFDQLIHAKRRTFLEYNVGRRNFTLYIVWQPDDRALLDGGVRIQDFLDFARPHLEARRVDHVFHPVNKQDVTLSVEHVETRATPPRH